MANPLGSHQEQAMIGEMAYQRYKGMCPNLGITEKSGPGKTSKAPDKFVTFLCKYI